MSYHLLECQCNILSKYNCRNGKIKYEQELRYAIYDPIVEMVMNAAHLEVCVVSLNNFLLCTQIMLEMPVGDSRSIGVSKKKNIGTGVAGSVTEV